MTREQSTLNCELCHRVVDLDIIDCQDRISGHCPFQFRRSRYGIFGLGIRETLFNESRGIMLRRERLFGIEWARSGASSQEILPPVVQGLKHFDFPPSVGRLISKDSSHERNPKSGVQGGHVAETASLGLIAQDLLKVRRAQSLFLGLRGDGYVFTPHTPEEFIRATTRVQNNNQPYYLIVPGDASCDSMVGGILEERIMEVARNWSDSPQAKEWPLPPTIYLLVQAIFDTYHSSPGQWLLDLVLEDAVSSGLLVKKSRGWMRAAVYEPTVSIAPQMIKENATLTAWKSQLSQKYPEFIKAVADEIVSAIQSRETTD